jgi:prepilin-type processing-associated H-X9-DG protein
LVPGDGDDGTTSTPVTYCTSPKGTLHLTWDNGALWWNAVLGQLGIDYYGLQVAYVDQHGGALPGPGKDSIVICPSMSDVVLASGDAGTGITVDGNGMMMLHGAPPRKAGTGDLVLPTCLSYVLNSKLNGTQPTQKISQLEPSTSVAILVEKRMNPGEIPKTDQFYATLDGKNLGQLKIQHNRFTYRHRGGGHICFVDGHVAWFSFDELNTPFETSPVLDYNNPNKVVWDPFGPES